MLSTARPPRALIVGGSLGGLFAANLLLRQGWDVEVFEHSGEDLVGRGAGIITHPEIFQILARIGIPIDESFGVDIPGRVTFDRSGAAIATLALPQKLTTWGQLYILLKAALPAERYHFGFSFKRLDQDASGVTAHFANGSEARGDLLVGADGIRSAVRAQLAPEAKPRYVGYIAWRELADALRAAGNDVPAAFAPYQAQRMRFGAAIVNHGRELGAYLQGSNKPEALRHHTPAVAMREIAVTMEIS